MVFTGTGLQGADAILLEFPKKAAGSLGAGRSAKKRFLTCQMSSVYQAAG